MAYKIIIDNKISTKVKGFYRDAKGVSRAFNFELEQDRVDQEELQTTLNDKNERPAEFLRRITTGWKGQRLVLDEGGQPADFNSEAFDVLLNVPGMAYFCLQAYLAQVLVNEKN